MTATQSPTLTAYERSLELQAQQDQIAAELATLAPAANRAALVVALTNLSITVNDMLVAVESDNDAHYTTLYAGSDKGIFYGQVTAVRKATGKIAGLNGK